MTLIDSKFRSKYRSLIRKARSERIRCVELESDLWYASRRAKGHGRYLIYLAETKSGLFATCRTIKGANCPSYQGCVHVAAVYERLVARLNKRERSNGTKAA